jgi:Xaa-Pro aminopeptidase
MKALFFEKNRHRISRLLRGGIIVISSYSQMQRGNDASFSFEQEANFWWLTGIEAPDWRVIIDGTRNKSWLVRPKVSDVHEIFDGSLSPDDAQRISGVDAVIDQDEAERLIREYAAKHSVIYTLAEHPAKEHFDFITNPAGRQLYLALGRVFSDVQDCRRELAQLRAIKQPEEIAAIKKAIKLTVAAFSDVKILLPEFKKEYEVEAEFTYAFRRAGATGHAYDPIVAGGKNAVTLHYNQNNDSLKQHSLLLLDIGARVGGYAADVTRTYAIGAPTERQIAVHAAVERAHKQIIALLTPGLQVADYQDSVDAIMRGALEGLGLLIEPENYQKYFPHAISHGLGIDVHDSLGNPMMFQPGMVLTVEPGIYIPEEGIGVRIEDDILITETGHNNLSAALSTSL